MRANTSSRSHLRVAAPLLVFLLGGSLLIAGVWASFAQVGTQGAIASTATGKEVLSGQVGQPALPARQPYSVAGRELFPLRGQLSAVPILRRRYCDIVLGRPGLHLVL